MKSMVEKTDAATDKIAKSSSPAGGKTLATRDEGRYMVPPVDIYETENALSVIADLPGVQKKDVNINVDQNILTIKGKVQYEPPKGSVRNEFSLINFFRQFQLSDEVDQAKITAESKNGVLTITLPKAEKAKPRQIAVKVG
jgi:HSP20 family protein